MKNVPEGAELDFNKWCLLNSRLHRMWTGTVIHWNFTVLEKAGKARLRLPLEVMIPCSVLLRGECINSYPMVQSVGRAPVM